MDAQTMESMRVDARLPERNAARPIAPELNVQAGDAVRQWIQLKQKYLALRGADPGKNQKLVPRTTHSDVVQIATAWSRELHKVEPRNEHERREHARWTSCAEQVAKLYDKANPGGRYPENERFWQDCTPRLAVYLESRKVVPSKWQLFLDAVVEAAAEVPTTIGRAGREVATGAAALLKEPGKLAALVIGSVIVLPPLLRALLR